MNEQQQQYTAAAGQTEAFSTPLERPSPVPVQRRLRFLPHLQLSLPLLIGGGVLGIALLIGGVGTTLLLNHPGRQVAGAFAKVSEEKRFQYEGKATTRINGLAELFGTAQPKSQQTTRDPSLTRSTTQLASAQLTTESDSSSPADVSLSWSGYSDVTDTNKPEATGSIQLSADVAKVSAVSLGLDYILTGDTGYFKVTGGEVLQPLLGDSSAISATWYKVGKKELEELGAAGQPNSNEKLSKEKVQKLTRAAHKSNLVSFKRLKPEKIDGIDANHYRYTINEQNLKKFIPEANQILYNKPLSEAETKDISSAFESFDFNPGEIWIDKKDKLPHKITFGIKSNSKEFSDVLVSFSMNEFGKRQSVNAPQNAKNLSELYGDFSDASEDGGSSKGSRNSHRKTDLHEYKVALAQYDSDTGGYPVQSKPAPITRNSAVYKALQKKGLVTAELLPGTNDRRYYYVSNGRGYAVCVNLEKEPETRYQVGPSVANEVRGNAVNCKPLD